jgi:putative glycosyltransferase (TIGR04348 family)
MSDAPAPRPATGASPTITRGVGDKPRVAIVSPALADANNGNWQTARRWQGFLSPVADVTIATGWDASGSDGTPIDAMIALHARRSAAAVQAFHAAHAQAPITVVLTGTDLYRDLAADPPDPDARHALECASHVVVLQPRGHALLPPAVRPKARCILQSATRLRHVDDGPAALPTFVAVGHLRDEKDPLTLMAAAALLDADAPVAGSRIVHLGRALDDALGVAAAATMRGHPAVYRWLGDRPHAVARRWVARAAALVHTSRMEGGANVVIEALRSGTPVIASRIDGNLGLLGDDYEGCFAVGDAAGLAALLRRFVAEPAFADRLRAQCAAREALFAPSVERAALRALLADMLCTTPAGRRTPLRIG